VKWCTFNRKSFACMCHLKDKVLTKGLGHGPRSVLTNYKKWQCQRICFDLWIMVMIWTWELSLWYAVFCKLIHWFAVDGSRNMKSEKSGRRQSIGSIWISHGLYPQYYLMLYLPRLAIPVFLKEKWLEKWQITKLTTVGWASWIKLNKPLQC
jgi:hypothetical protein